MIAYASRSSREARGVITTLQRERLRQMQYVHAAIIGEDYDSFCGQRIDDSDSLTWESDDITCPDCLQVIDANDY